MAEGMARFEQFLVTIPSAVIVAICFLLVVYRMIDGELPAIPGFGTLIVLIGLLWLCVWPPHPVLPAIILLSVVALMVLFPFAERQMALVELREYDVERFERAIRALEQKADNPSALFEAARWLAAQGFHADAIAIGDVALTMLSTKRDEIRNTSMREQFRAEERMVNEWRRLPIQPVPGNAHECRACRTSNIPGTLFCSGCRRPYLLDRLKGVDLRARFWGRLVLTWALIGGTVAGAAAIGLVTSGIMRLVAVGGGLAILGLLLGFLFRMPRPGRD